MSDLFSDYRPLPGARDEMIDAHGQPWPEVAGFVDLFRKFSPEALRNRASLADVALMNQGVTFSVYADNRGQEKVFPVDIIPRVIDKARWDRLEKGIEQRVRALELFLRDVYGPQKILDAGVVPRELVLGAKYYLPTLRGVPAPGDVRVHISGVDLIQDPEGEFRVLEDNLRTPSGVSYVLENRGITKRIMPRTFESARPRRVDHYPARLAEALRSVAPRPAKDTSVVVLTPGPYNSAYYEHSFLARTMGLELVEAPDLFVDDDRVYVRTTRGPRRVDVIYRRTDEAFLDPEVFRPDSLLGVRGLMRAWANGNVTLANAPGNGVADDKAIYALVPDIIKYYLGEEPLLGQVETYLCVRDKDRAYVLENLDKLVVKAVDEAGGYGMLMGPQASQAERDTFARQIIAEPRRYIAQPRIELSTCPTMCDAGLAPRRVDLRPYVLQGRDSLWVLPGGLTRVALVEGSYVVNSSQGGGSKDTWVLDT